MHPLLNKIRARIAAALHELAHNDLGYTSETVIWTAVLSGLALTVGGIFGPEILDAARSVSFE
ncbi:hypothetical protein DVA86_28110 [Streptomyces armeniacus]|uniref:Uncharacterized protein n=1 Tax=Streptomyces armeniacus TaxID=83291 RepID=A0A345XW88_9ACTN|nr:hypothetical protein [Streptomyces armeniacus]AXK35904.1 hypothetical protein DVA86_28110 [Streptomyces armeniacus]